jgi:hypothetical protein
MKSVKKLAAAPLASKMCTNAGYLCHGSLEGIGFHWPSKVKEKKPVKKLAAAHLASKMCTHAGYLGHGSLEGMGVLPWPSVDEEEVFLKVSCSAPSVKIVY